MCKNRLAAPGDLLGSLVVSALTQVVDPAFVIETVEREVAAAAAQRGDHAGLVASLEAAVAKSRGRIARLTDAIADADDAESVAALKARLKDEAAQKKVLEGNLAAAKTAVASSDTAQVTAHVRAQVEPYAALLASTDGNLPAVRRALRRLGVQVRVHPVTGPVRQRSVTVEVSGTFKSLLPDDVVAAYFTGTEAPTPAPISGGSDGPEAPAAQPRGCSDGKGPPMPPRGLAAAKTIWKDRPTISHDRGSFPREGQSRRR